MVWQTDFSNLETLFLQIDTFSNFMVIGALAEYVGLYIICCRNENVGIHSLVHEVKGWIVFTMQWECLSNLACLKILHVDFSCVFFVFNCQPIDLTTHLLNELLILFPGCPDKCHGHGGTPDWFSHLLHGDSRHNGYPCHLLHWTHCREWASSQSLCHDYQKAHSPQMIGIWYGSYQSV